MRGVIGGVALALLAGAASGQSAPRPGPAQGTLLAAQAGDTACHLTIRDDAGARADWMAGFELCEKAAGAIGRRFAFDWQAGNVLHPSCQGNVDCGRSLRVMLVQRMTPLAR